MAAEREAPVPASAPPAPVVLASPEAVGGAPMGAETVLSLQRTAGNQAVCRAIETGQIMRDTKQVGVTGVTVTPERFTKPLESGVSVKATAQPSNATGVTWKLKDGTAAVTGSSIDAKGAITIGGSQPGGTLEADATADDGAGFSQPFNVVEKPTTLASTEGSASGTYAATFTHAFTGASGTATGVERAAINEKFDSKKVNTDFGEFTLTANKGTDAWDLDAAGKMVKPDNVSIDKDMIDANKFVKTASNPSPAKALPAGFTMKQHLHARSLPSAKQDAAEFTSTDHVRTLDERGGKLKVVLKAGSKEVPIDYDGAPVFRGAKADKTSVEASGPKPAAGDWTRNSVQVSVTVEPSSASVTYSFVGDALGCEVDDTGKVLIGEKTGSIKVRAGDAKHFDEVSVTITARTSTAAPKSAVDGSGAEPLAAPPAGEAPPEPVPF